MTLLATQFPGELRKAAGGYDYFLPASLGHSVDLRLQPSLVKQLQDAAFALGEFSHSIDSIPNPQQFIRAYVGKEAVMSSRIEGIRTTIADVFVQQEDVEPERRDDWAEVDAYIRGMDYALKRRGDLPLCNRLIKETHKVLMAQVRGQHKQPGEYRRSQNWLGGSRPSNALFVPPVHEHLAELMGDLERFIQIESAAMPELIVAALLHYQFETIHPFLDGNGRTGRMLIPLYLMEKKILAHPILYVSSFLEENRRDYYAMLDGARQSPEGVMKWISFFLDAIEATSRDGVRKTQELIDYDLRVREEVIPRFGSRSKKALQVLEYLYQSPYVQVKDLQRDLQFSTYVSQSLIKGFVEHRVLVEVTGQKRNRVFVFDHYLKLLGEGLKCT